MKKTIYVPIESIDKRYTNHLHLDILDYLNTNNINYIEVKAQKLDESFKLADGMFLDAASTIFTKSHQMCEIANMYRAGLIDNETTFFFSDIWFPGIESLAYLNYFHNVKPKITGFLHAGSFTDTDFVRDMERWAKMFEEIVFDIADEIFVGSEFIKNDVIKKRLIDKNKLTVTHLPLDKKLDSFNTTEKENIVIFNGRLCDEKQPHLFLELADKFENQGYTFINTQSLDMTKEKYYKLLAKSKFVVSFALQENFGFGIAEAVKLGCIPVLPNKLVYPEFYNKAYLYNSFEECAEKLANFMFLDTKHQLIQPEFANPFNKWFK